MSTLGRHPRIPHPGRAFADERTRGHPFRFSTTSVLVALGLSLLAHILWVVISHFVLVGGGRLGGGGEEGSGPVEFAVMTQGELAAAMDGSVDLQTPSVPDAVSTDADARMVQAAPGDVAGDAASGEMSGGSLAGTDIGSGESGGGMGEGLAGAGGGGVSFFGVEAKGERFAFIVDVSGSMEFGGKIEALRVQLAEAIGGMVETGRFIVIPFSDDAQPMGNKPDWTEASQAGKKWGRTQVALLRPLGGTNPVPGFRLAFSMKPRPDAMYFMTDGEFDPSVAEEVMLMNKNLKIPIHCICFSSRESEEHMKRIAKSSRGTYTFVPGP